MKFPKLGVASLAIAISITAITPHTAHAREPGNIYGPIINQYKSITDARKKLRSKEKKQGQLTGDEYYTVAFACAYEKPASASIILTELGRSRCKDQVIDYYLEAGRRGTPEGFLAAAERETNPADAYGFAQLAYQLSGTDIALRDDAAAILSRLRPTIGNPAPINAQAQAIVQQLLGGGRYPGAIPAAGDAELAKVLPDLKWLDFKNPKRCTWSDAADAIFANATGFDERKMYGTIPATVRIPGIARPVTSRITRPEKSAPGIVTYYLDFKGRWNGLTVLGLTDTFVEMSEGVDGTGIRFAEPVDVVARRLAQVGFVVNPKGGSRNQVDKRDRDGNIDGVVTYLERQKGETVFLCDEVYYASYGEP